MSEATVPGMKAAHAIITPNCRVVQGGPGDAFDEAVRRIRAEYVACQLDCNAEASYHLVLTVDRT